jgi:hypothetical protein
MSTNEKTDDAELFTLLDSWKLGYVKAIATELKPSATLLQIGFKDNLLADALEGYKPTHHIIVEGNALKAQLAHQWAAGKPHVTVIASSWQEALPSLGKFDSIVYSNSQSTQNRDVELFNALNQEALTTTAERAQELLHILEEQFEQIQIQFSDADLEDFCQNNSKLNPQAIERFFSSLETHGQITKQQRTSAWKRYLQLHRPHPEVEDSALPKDLLLPCLQACLKNHMHKGSHFSALLDRQLSKYGDNDFLQAIISNPEVNYKEQLVAIDLPPSAYSNRFTKALVIGVEKL